MSPADLEIVWQHDEVLLMKTADIQGTGRTPDPLLQGATTRS
uniref:Uncharacterized protein n=4 Tax=unclassified Arthrobacter TaxID=235627 RepID=I3W1A9_9MICC|nr:hypothetical protein [Arthrobacter sp. J3.37]AFK89386.1 hypothetical protein [Arthrobacter sp. J3.40]AFK89561.1 hypothetical protein [Arthrobacter sp. J3.49]AFK89638.1 hypothetical protein [Arthrobacter sp. J3.53]